MVSLLLWNHQSWIIKVNGIYFQEDYNILSLILCQDCIRESYEMCNYRKYMLMID